MNVLAGLMNPNAIGQGIQQSFQEGMDQRRKLETRNALAQYAQNPSAQGAAMVAQHDPEMGIKLGQYENERAETVRKTQLEEQTRQLAARAAQGDKGALLGLWGVDLDTAIKLDDRQADKALEGYEFISNAAFQIVQLPPEQQPAAWDAYIQQGMQMGFDGLGQFLGQYDPQTLNSVVAKAGQMKEYQQFQQPKYTPIGEAGLAGFQFGQPIQEGGQPQNFGNIPAPPPGFVLDEGGPASAPGTFRP
jgi:hypothetical protein